MAAVFRCPKEYHGAEEQWAVARRRIWRIIELLNHSISTEGGAFAVAVKRLLYLYLSSRLPIFAEVETTLSHQL
jgi:hypothetical protein